MLFFYFIGYNVGMTGIINLFLPLFINLLVLYFMSSLLGRLVLRRLGRGWYLATMWPGVVMHELSHLVACWVTLTRVYRVEFFKPSGDRLGMVEHGRSKNPITNILISTAPLFGITAIIWLLTKYIFPDLYLAQISNINTAITDFSTFQIFFNFTKDYFFQYWDYIRELFISLNFSSWQTYLFIYMMFTLSSHAAPSKQDLKYTFWGIFGLILLFTLIYYIDQWLQVPITWNIIQWLTKPLYLATGFIAYGIIFTVFSLILMSIFSLFVRIFRKM